MCPTVALIAGPPCPCFSGASARLAPLWACLARATELSEPYACGWGSWPWRAVGSPREPVSAAWGGGAFFMTLKLPPFSVFPRLRAHGTAWSRTVPSAALSRSTPAACLRRSLWTHEKARVRMTVHFPQVLTLLVGCLHLVPSRPRGPSRGTTRRAWPLQEFRCSPHVKPTKQKDTSCFLHPNLSVGLPRNSLC